MLFIHFYVAHQAAGTRSRNGHLGSLLVACSGLKLFKVCVVGDVNTQRRPFCQIKSRCLCFWLHTVNVTTHDIANVRSFKRIVMSCHMD